MLETKVALALTDLLVALRDDWTELHVKRVLYAAREMGTGYEVAVASLLVAATPANRTPEVVAMDGPHWRATRRVLGTPAATPTARKGAACQVCGMARDVCEERWSTDHQFESIDDARARRAGIERQS